MRLNDFGCGAGAQACRAAEWFMDVPWIERRADRAGGGACSAMQRAATRRHAIRAGYGAFMLFLFH